MFMRKQPCDGPPPAPTPLLQGRVGQINETPRGIGETGFEAKIDSAQAHQYEEFFMRF
jgi:hypothetical protein